MLRFDGFRISSGGPNGGFGDESEKKKAVMAKDSTVITVIRPMPEKNTSSRDACLVVINGADLGKKYNLAQDETMIGRSSKVDIQIDEESISRNHATIANENDNIIIRDLRSTNGTYVNDQSIDEFSLRDGDQVKIGRTIFKFLSGSNVEASYHDEIYRLTTTDGLTQVYNKRYFLQEMDREMSRCLRYQRDLSLVMLDIDHFKPVNDTYGHLAGDHILKQCAQRIVQTIRRDDIFARYGGEEFILLLPEVAKAQGIRTAEKIRTTIERKPFVFDGVEISITLSLGVADLQEYLSRSGHNGSGEANHEVNAFAFIKLADDRLYKAKESGRNRVVGE